MHCYIVARREHADLAGPTSASRGFQALFRYYNKKIPVKKQIDYDQISCFSKISKDYQHDTGHGTKAQQDIGSSVFGTNSSVYRHHIKQIVMQVCSKF